MRVLTLNLLDRGQADGPARRGAARPELTALRPDVVALQEVTRTADVDEVSDLFGGGFAAVDHPGAIDGVGACLASRWPLGEPRVLRLPTTDGLPWAATVVVEVDVPDGPVLVAHHKPSWQRDREHEREVQAVAAARFVEDVVADRPGLPVVLLGDLDAGPDTASMRFLTGRQSLDGMSVRYEDAWEAVHPDDAGHTFTPRNPLVAAGEMPLERGRRIDHVLVRSGPHGPPLDVVDCRLVLDEAVDGIWASDHFGVLVDLRRPPHPPGTWAEGGRISRRARPPSRGR